MKSLVEERVPKYLLNVYDEAIASKSVKDATKSKRETSVTRVYGGGCSIRRLNEHRLVDGFESKKDAEIRTLNDKFQISSGLKRRHKPVGDLEKLADTWRSKECLDYVNGLPDGESINFSMLARKFGLKDVNCKQKDNKGQIVKEFLKSKGVDVGKFSYHAKMNEEGVNIRRKKKRLDNFNRISVPMDPTPQQVTADLILKVEEGKYTLGELVVPIKFKKIVVTKDGHVKEEEFTLCGRKDRLINIRQNLYERHKLYYRVPKSDCEIENMTKEDVIEYLMSINEDICNVDDDVEELKDRLKYFQRRRHLMMWHDGATICNHGHILFTCSEVYDKAIHLTDQEALHKYGRKVDVQETIEKPEIYMFARCPGTTVLTAYSSTRMDDIMELDTPVIFDNGMEVYDVMRFFKGDGPSCQFESGQQKGGNYFCWTCGIPSYRVKDYVHAAYRKNISLHDRQQKVLTSNVSCSKSREGFTNLYEKLTKAQIIEELDDREIKWTASDTSADLLNLLKTNMHGIQRVPSLLFNRPEDDIEDLMLGHYEILPCEPLHDIENHIKNLFEEIPHHMGDDKKPIKEFLVAVFNGKECKRGCDYRLSLIKVFGYFKEKYPEHAITEILYTLCEIQKILYLQESQRTVANVLHLYIQSFLHAIMINIAFGKNIKSSTERKFYGKYYHAIISHVCDQYRIVDGRSSNTENEERCFNTLKTTSNNTSNHFPDHIISNAFIRCQVSKDFNDDDTILRTEAAITKTYNSIFNDVKDSIISFEIMEKYPWEYQALLEKIADYLKEGVFWREVRDGVKFMDVDKVESKLNLHHFRSSNISKELDHVQRCWENSCLNNPDKLIPAFKIKVEDNLGRTSIKILKTLSHKEILTEYSSVQSINNDELCESSIEINPELSIINSTPKCDDNITYQTGISHSSAYGEVQESCTTDESAPILGCEDLNEPCNSNFVDFVTSTPKCSREGIKTLQGLIDNKVPKQDCIDTEQDCVIQVKVNEPVFPRKDGKNYDETTIRLIDVFGETEFVQEYASLKNKVQKYPSQEFYWQEYRYIVAKLEVKLKVTHDKIMEELKSIQRNRLKYNYISLSLLPNEGDDKPHVDELIGKLKSIALLKPIFYITTSAATTKTRGTITNSK